jgi:alpha-tubulin suppressor-like RCC1 family protein
MMKTILTIFLAFILLGCGEDKMAHIGEETEIDRDSIITNVTDDAQEYDTTKLTVSSHLGDSSFIIKNGVLYAAGSNSKGELGFGDTTSRNVFTSTGITDVKSVSAGDRSTAIIKTDGSVWVCGYNAAGGLGLGDTDDRLEFTPLNIPDIKSIHFGGVGTGVVVGGHSMIIKTDGTLWSCGNNYYGQAGQGAVKRVDVFTDTGVSDVKFVALGGDHSMIIKTDGSLLSCGNSTGGKLGLNSYTSKNIFTDTGVSDVKLVSLGANHSAIILNDGTLKTCGLSDEGQLGNSNLTDVLVFSATTLGAAPVKTVSCGSAHTMAIKEDGTLLGAGRNNEGQLGINAVSTAEPTFISYGITTATHVYSGQNHSILEKADNIIYSSGSNSGGQLALGDYVDTIIFVSTTQVPDETIIENWTPFYSGDSIRLGDDIYYLTLIGTSIPSIHTVRTKIGVVNELKPFDGQNIVPAIFASPMTYTITATEAFNAFTLAKVLADSVTYTFKNSVGAIIKGPITATIDTKRDINGILSAYPTTVVYYADEQIEAGGTVEISLTRASGNIELGQFPLNNMIDIGFSNLDFKNKPKDYNDYTPDEWGNVPESVKAIVTTFSGTLDITLDSLDYVVSFSESISGKNVTIDFSDSNGAVANGTSIFSTLIRRGRALFETNSVVKDGELYIMAKSKLTFTEVA